MMEVTQDHYVGNEGDPIVVIWEEECKVRKEAWIKYDEVVANVDSRHISCDLASTWIWSQDKLYLDPTLKHKGSE